MGHQPSAHPGSTSKALARLIRALLAIRPNQLRQIDIATHIGISQSSVSGLLGGRRDFNISHLQSFGELLGVKPHELLEKAELLEKGSDIKDIIDLGGGGSDDQ